MRWAIATIIGLVLGCVLAAHVRADEVHLVGGAVIEGKATRRGDKVLVEVESGQISLPAESVERIVGGESDVQRFEALYAKLQAGDIKALLSLANFCRDHGMVERERQMLQKVIELSPDHADARARLGFVRADAGWIKREEQLRQAGFVPHEGRWVSRQELLELERLQAQTTTAEHERDKAQAELQSKTLELSSRHAQVAHQDQLAAEQAQRAQALPLTTQTPFMYYTPYAPYGGYGAGWNMNQGAPVAPRRAPTRADNFPIPGVRDPWDFIRGQDHRR